MKTTLDALLKQITPLPWRLDTKGWAQIKDSNDNVLAKVDVSLTNQNREFKEAQANAAYLTHAANVLPVLVEALEGVLRSSETIFRLATDSIVHQGDGVWACKSCGMELSDGGGHSDSCCASAILDLAVPLHNAERALTTAKEIDL